MGKGSNTHKGGKREGKDGGKGWKCGGKRGGKDGGKGWKCEGKRSSCKGKDGYNPHIRPQEDGELRLVCYSDGAPSKCQAASCLHVTSSGFERADKNNVFAAAVVRGSSGLPERGIPSGFVCPGFWELVGVHLSLEQVHEWQRQTGKPWNDVVVSLYNDSIPCMEFLTSERCPGQAGAPHLVRIVRLVTGELCTLAMLGATVVVWQCFRDAPPMKRAHFLAHQGAEHLRPELYTPDYMEAWNQAQEVYWNASASDRETMACY